MITNAARVTWQCVAAQSHVPFPARKDINDIHASTTCFDKANLLQFQRSLSGSRTIFAVVQQNFVGNRSGFVAKQLTEGMTEAFPDILTETF